MLSSEVREQASMEQVVEGTTEFTPKSEQQQQMDLPNWTYQKRANIPLRR